VTRHAAWLAALQLLACGAEEPQAPAAEAGPPNVLFVVWDTVRADRLSLYGYPRPTTPRLDAWAADARVFSDALATASSTVPTHASLFTGLLPSEHGADADHPRLDGRFTTLAESFQDAGYRTYLWAANPHVSAAKNFTQGFDAAAHPWDAENREQALALVRAKVPEDDRSSALHEKLGRADASDWVLSASGALAAERAADFAAADPERPWLVFLNYMEAHRPYVPPRRYRGLFLDEADVERSYALDRSWPAVWAHVFGIRRYTPEELEVIGGTYDAALRELDDLFAGLLATFSERGLLERETLIVLTADHGELLGEHGLLDHQYSLYQPLVRVPLVLHAPGRVEPGVSDAPVMAMDLYPTLLELAGIPSPKGQRGRARSLLEPAVDRARLAEYPAVFSRPLRTAHRLDPELPLEGWTRRLRAFDRGGWKLIEGEDGRHELYDVASDPGETRNRVDADPARREALRDGLYEAVRELRPLGEPEPVEHEVGSEEAALLEQLGYAAPGDAPTPRGGAAPTTSWSFSD